MALSAWKSPFWHSEELVNLEVLRQQWAQIEGIALTGLKG